MFLVSNTIPSRPISRALFREADLVFLPDFTSIAVTLPFMEVTKSSSMCLSRLP